MENAVKIPNELIMRLQDIAEELSEYGKEFSSDFEFGTVKFTFTQPASELE